MFFFLLFMASIRSRPPWPHLVPGVYSQSFFAHSEYNIGLWLYNIIQNGNFVELISENKDDFLINSALLSRCAFYKPNMWTCGSQINNPCLAPVEACHLWIYQIYKSARIANNCKSCSSFTVRVTNYSSCKFFLFNLCKIFRLLSYSGNWKV